MTIRSFSKNLYSFFLTSTLLQVGSYAQASPWGYVSYHTANMGDDIQAIAARQFLPQDAIGLDRDYLAVYEGTIPIRMLMNGWFLHTRQNFWCRPDLVPPSKCWPPASTIKPLIISMHIDSAVEQEIFSSEGIKFLQNCAPIGARDWETFQKLAKRKIPVYFSGCLTLTLERDCNERGNAVYAVDTSSAMTEELKRHYGSNLEEITHVRPLICLLRNDQRIQFAKKYLELYQKALFVVTRRLHAAMPCLAYDTPLFLEHGFLPKPSRGGRFGGLAELTHHGNLDQIRSGKVDYDLSSPRLNPRKHVALKEQMISRIEEWKQAVSE